MKKNVGVATGIGIAIIVTVILFQVNQTMWQQVSVEEFLYFEGKILAGYRDSGHISGGMLPTLEWIKKNFTKI